MRDFASVLRIQGGVKFYDELINHFGEKLCSIYKSGEVVGPEFSFAPIKRWPGDVLIMTPQMSAQSGVVEQIDFICNKLEENEDVLQKLLLNGGRLDISCSCNSDEKIGDFKVSAAQLRCLSKFEASIFFRFIIHDVFAK